MENIELAKPLGDRVLIEVETKEKTASGIIIPDSANSGDNKIGKVISVGNGIYTQTGILIPMEVEVGDEVMLSNGMNTSKIKLGNKNYFLCREMDLLMVIKQK
jgi:chaperonin GroES